MSLVEESFGHRSLENRYSSSSNWGCHESQEHRSLETSHTSSSNCGGRGRRSSMTSHSPSRNHGGCADICGSRLEDTINYSSCNQEIIFHVEGRSGYMYLTSPYHPHNSSDISRSLVLYSYGIDISVHRSKISQFYAYKHGGI